MSDDSMFEEAKILAKLINDGATTVCKVTATVANYSKVVTKVKADFWVAAQPALTIEYWGNADREWVQKNIQMNAKMVRDGK